METLFAVLFVTILTWVIFCVLVTLAFVIVAWTLAHFNIFFGFVREGTGYSVVTRGGKLVSMGLSWRGHRIVLRDTWVIESGDPIRDTLVRKLLGILEDTLGIYWMGWWPIQMRHVYRMSWLEWDDRSSEVAGKFILRPRGEDTDFFFAARFEYALFLEAAETGGEAGTENVPVNVKSSVFLRIVKPEIALFRNDDWFQQFASFGLGSMREHTGSNRFDALRKEVGSEGGGYVGRFLRMNTVVPGTEITVGQGISLENLLGLSVDSAQVVDVSVYDPKGLVLEATTARYRKEQEKLGLMQTAEGQAFQVRELGKARADAVKAEAAAVAEHGEAGMHVRRQQAIEKAGEQGNTIVFDSGGPTRPYLAAELAGDPTRKRGAQGETPESEQE